MRDAQNIAKLLQYYVKKATTYHVEVFHLPEMCTF